MSTFFLRTAHMRCRGAPCWSMQNIDTPFSKMALCCFSSVSRSCTVMRPSHSTSNRFRSEMATIWVTARRFTSTMDVPGSAMDCGVAAMVSSAPQPDTTPHIAPYARFAASCTSERSHRLSPHTQRCLHWLPQRN